MSEQSSGGDAVRFFGWLILIVAVLWMAFSGLCAAAMIVSMIGDAGLREDTIGWGVLILMVSGISAAMAYALFVVGRGMSRGK